MKHFRDDTLISLESQNSCKHALRMRFFGSMPVSMLKGDEPTRTTHAIPSLLIAIGCA